MSEDPSFRDLIRRVRAGDEQAAAALVRQYEPTLRLVIRRRLTDPVVRRFVDSLDICQSVLGSFFVRVAAGQYDLETPDQLLRLLNTMARNKVVNRVKKEHANRRRPPDGVPRREGKASPSPSEVIANQELLRQLLARLSAEERQLADLRAAGKSWDEIAAVVGGNPDALRMRLNRAVNRVARELGMDG